MVVKSATHLEFAGEMVDLRHIGQKKLEKLVDHQTACWSERIATRDGDRTAAPHFATARAAHVALPTPLQQSIFVHIYSHGAWCQQKLHERGGAEHPHCLLCGQCGSLAHRWLTCPHWHAERQKRLTVRQREFAAKWAHWDIRSFERLALPDYMGRIYRGFLPKHSTCQVEHHADGTPFFAFTDGTAKHPASHPLRRAGWAAVVYSEDGVKLCTVSGK
eukprot:4793932-Amphidinium_carterae.1